VVGVAVFDLRDRVVSHYVKTKIALQQEELLARVARERQVETGEFGKEGGRGNKKTLVQNSAQGLPTNKESRKTRSKVAKAGCSLRSPLARSVRQQ
jgi:hypothetical protein